MIRIQIYIFIIVSAYAQGCPPKNQEPIVDMNQGPVHDEDQVLAEVFRPLDGRWEGLFRIYEDQRGQPSERIKDNDIHPHLIRELPLKQNGEVKVRQEYISESPYFQRVAIEDTYLENDSLRTVRSFGVNKVESGQMWCVVQKPDELIVHQGQTEGNHTICWSRHLEEPLVIEFFRETVLDSTYEIIGYGYYGQDNPQKGPKTWFYGKYRRLQ